MNFLNGEQTETITIADRGLQYGDGVWETLAIRNGRVMQLPAHLARLKKGINALSINGYRESVLLEDIEQVLASAEPSELTSILKIIITRGVGGRGYNPQGCNQPNRIVSLHPWPKFIHDYATEGVHITLCNNRLSHNPLLAGFKHLNRLEQVLARAEFSDEYQEGLVMDFQDNVIEGTMSNLFVIHSDTHISTPDLTLCGIRGIARSCILDELRDMGVEIDITNVSVDDILQARGLFLTNSILQIWPVKQFQQRHYGIPTVVKTLQERIKEKL